MDWTTLKRIADDGSITADANDDTGIVAVTFTINGGHVTAQYSASGHAHGVYAFTIWNSTELLKVLDFDAHKEPGCVFSGDDNDED